MADRRRSEARATCTTYACDEPATRRLRYPMRYVEATFEGDYCDAHATEILRDAWTWPDAKEVKL